MRENNNPNRQRSASQTERIYDYLQEGYKITPLEALMQFNCMRLQARIYDIEQRHGIKVQRKLVDVVVKGGSTAKVMQYWL